MHPWEFDTISGNTGRITITAGGTEPSPQFYSEYANVGEIHLTPTFAMSQNFYDSWEARPGQIIDITPSRPEANNCPYCDQDYDKKLLKCPNCGAGRHKK